MHSLFDSVHYWRILLVLLSDSDFGWDFVLLNSHLPNSFLCHGIGSYYAIPPAIWIFTGFSLKWSYKKLNWRSFRFISPQLSRKNQTQIKYAPFSSFDHSTTCFKWGSTSILANSTASVLATLHFPPPLLLTHLLLTRSSSPPLGYVVRVLLYLL